MNRLIPSIAILTVILFSCVEKKQPKLNVVKLEEKTIIEVVDAVPEAIFIDSVVFMNEILPPIKKYHAELFKKDYGVTSKYSKPGDLVETWTDSIYNLEFKLYKFEGNEKVIIDSSMYLGSGHSIEVPIQSFMNIYSNKSILKGDIDNNGEDDLLLTTYFYFGGNRGGQTLFIFLSKGGKFTLTYNKATDQDGFQKIKDGVFYGKYSDGGYHPTHFYTTEYIFRDGGFVLVKKTLKEYLVKKADGGWEFIKADSVTYKVER